MEVVASELKTPGEISLFCELTKDMNLEEVLKLFMQTTNAHSVEEIIELGGVLVREVNKFIEGYNVNLSEKLHSELGRSNKLRLNVNYAEEGSPEYYNKLHDWGKSLLDLKEVWMREREPEAKFWVPEMNLIGCALLHKGCAGLYPTQ